MSKNRQNRQNSFIKEEKLKESHYLILKLNYEAAVIKTV